MIGLFGMLLMLASDGCDRSGHGLPPYAVESHKLAGPGAILFTGKGYALYVYLPDRHGASRCKSVCAKAWPPLLLPAGIRHPSAGRGVNASLLGTIRRPGGALQVTYRGWPLYTYLDDSPGVVNGQGEGMGAWYLITPAGTVDTAPLVTSR